MNAMSNKKAVIYCRVSSVKQTTQGTGLESQETRCREFAAARGYDVVKVFRDDTSGSIVDRPGMKAMLAYLRAQRKQRMVVIIDDISRLARGIEAHLQIRADIARTGADLESPTIEFGDDSDSRLVENLLASVSQHQRQKNGEQTKNRMRARAQMGYWVFIPPWGYAFERQPGGSKLLVREEPLASILQEALEGYASGRFDSQTEVKRFIEAHPRFPNEKRSYIPLERVRMILTEPLYAGYIQVPKWDIGFRKAQHEGLIDLEAFQTIQDKLQGNTRAPTRTDLNADFPMRGFVACADCGQPMTANWSKGRKGLYPYYLCRQKGCERRGKSIARTTIEKALEGILRSLRPSRELFALVNDMFRTMWDAENGAVKEQRAALKLEAAALDKKIAQLVDRIVESDNLSLVSVYETKLDDLQRDKLLLAERTAKCGTVVRDYDATFRTALSFFSNPWNLWEFGTLADKRAVLKLTFAGHLTYDWNEGLRTAELSLPFRALQDVSGLKKEMVPRDGIEPPTPRALRADI
jgi:site-specific DNA recombinase